MRRNLSVNRFQSFEVANANIILTEMDERSSFEIKNHLLISGIIFRKVKFRHQNEIVGMASQEKKLNIYILAASKETMHLVKSYADKIRRSPSEKIKYSPIFLIINEPTESIFKNAIEYGIDDIVSHPITRSTFLTRLTMISQRETTFFETEDYFGPDRRRGCLSKIMNETRDEEKKWAKKILISRNFNEGCKIIETKMISGNQIKENYSEQISKIETIHPDQDECILYNREATIG